MARWTVRTLVATAALAVGVAATVTPATAGALGNASFRGEGINIRRCASDTCPVDGLGYSRHNVTAHCMREGWVHLTNHSTGVRGFVWFEWVNHPVLDPCP